VKLGITGASGKYGRQAADKILYKVAAGFEWLSEDMVSFEQAIRGGHFDICSNDVETLLGRPPERFSDFIARHRDALRAMVREDVR